MKVILRKDLEKLGKTGDVVTVKDGYARNYLIPRGYAYYASEGAIKAIEIEKKRQIRRIEQERSRAEKFAQELSQIQLTIPMRVGEEGKLYGSVTPAIISELLKSEHNIEIDRRQILVDEPIKTLGVFDVKIKLYQDIYANIKLWVIAEEE
ncbi:MAG: 50S ribosomal protein L9 [Ignavibacteria bacterium]|nr:50S ribosomal protein L9 [Ignavibacteria bacterium]